jgi:hypothetical protein
MFSALVVFLNRSMLEIPLKNGAPHGIGIKMQPKSA